MSNGLARAALQPAASAALALSLALLVHGLAGAGQDLSLALVSVDGRTEAFVIPCGSPVALRFNNSATGSPVEIVFRACGGSLEGVEMITDSAGAEYYSQGLLDVNESVRGFRGEIAFCTGVGARLSIGGSARPVDPGSCVVIQFYRRSP